MLRMKLLAFRVKIALRVFTSTADITGWNFFSQTTDQNYNDIVFTNRFKKDSWDVITLKIGAGLAKLLRMESEGIYKKYWSASDWSNVDQSFLRNNKP